MTILLSDGSVRNGYTIKILNKSSHGRAYSLSASGIDAEMTIVGQDKLDLIKSKWARRSPEV